LILNKSGFFYARFRNKKNIADIKRQIQIHTPISMLLFYEKLLYIPNPDGRGIPRFFCVDTANSGTIGDEKHKSCVPNLYLHE